ncbi:MAG: sigma-70 family RNA polymerase sigma factor [Armatimonadetes bacterium]|nr:sigma-70 family RNA polymerase sigma factor [Armatimonadota bacterium]
MPGAKESGATSSGRKELFMRLARENEQVLVRVARRLCCGNGDLADDCVQEAIISAYQSFVDGKFDDVPNFRPWILRILTNRFYREASKARRHAGADDFEELADRHVDPSSVKNLDSIVEQTALREEIDHAFEQLSPEQALCVTLVDVEGLEYGEAARVLDVPIGTVRSRLNRARLKMAEAITQMRLRSNP